MRTLKLGKKALLTQISFATFGLLMTLRAFFPGLITSDALDQYQQAMHFNFNDWHPPIMSFIWAITNDWIPGAFGMLLLECLLYWGGLLLISLSIPQSYKKISLAVILVGFMPFAVGTLSHIWKDVLHAVIWLYAVGLICLGISVDNGRYKKIFLMAGAMLFVGSMVRFNAIFGLLPLVWLLLSKSDLQSWKKWSVVCILFPACCILLTTTFNYGFLNAAKSRVHQSLIVFDLGGISNFSGKDYFEENWSGDEGKKMLSTCYDAAAWDVYAWGPCSFVLNKVRNSGSWDDGSLMKKWIFAIYHEPRAYLNHRYANFMKLLWHPNSVLGDHTVENSLGLKYKKTGLFRILETTTNLLKNTIIFQPGFWLMASFVFSLYGLLSRKCFARDVFLALNTSSFLYLLAYLFVGVASDFRYAYWSILATSASVPFILLSIKTKE